MTLHLLPRRRAACAACGSLVGHRHAARCRTLVMTARLPSVLVTDDDAALTDCGCPLGLVRQFGQPAHRADCGRREVRRPPLLTRGALASLGALAFIAAAALYTGASMAYGSAYSPSYVVKYGIAVMMLGVALVVYVAGTLITVRREAPRYWHGQRVYLSGEPGRMQFCSCGGSGLVFAPAYPPVPTAHRPTPPRTAYVNIGGPGVPLPPAGPRPFRPDSC